MQMRGNEHGLLTIIAKLCVNIFFKRRVKKICPVYGKQDLGNEYGLPIINAKLSVNLFLKVELKKSVLYTKNIHNASHNSYLFTYVIWMPYINMLVSIWHLA